MRKYIFTTLTVLSTLLGVTTANAEVWIGGELAIRTSNTSLGSLHMDKNNSVEFRPEVGLTLSNDWAVALRLGYAHYDNANFDFIDQTIMGNCNQFSVEPFVRYTYLRKGNFSFFADGGLTFTTSKVSKYAERLKTFGLGVSPGLNYSVTPHFGLTGHLGTIGYNHSWMKMGSETLKNDEFLFNLFGSISIGAFVAF